MKKSNSLPRCFWALSFSLLVAALSNVSPAAPGDVDLSFDPGSGVDAYVQAMAIQSDGKIIIGGYFSTVKGLARHRIAGSIPTAAATLALTREAP